MIGSFRQSTDKSPWLATISTMASSRARLLPVQRPLFAAIGFGLGLVAVVGCHGSIGEPPSRGSSFGAAGAPTGNVGVGVSGSSSCSVTSAPAPVQRLTRLEYNNVVRDLFGVEKDYTATFSADAKGPAGFSTEGVAQNLALSQVTDYLNAAKAVVADVFAASPNPLLTCTSGDACAQSIITSLATKAFRGPPPPDEITKLMAVYKSSSSQVFTDALRLAVRAILVSPRFLFRVYQLPATGGTLTSLTDYEVASRLSFFLWGSIPDDALLADAGQGRLQQSDVLKGHVLRMLKDPRVAYLSSSFGSEWLQLDRFDSTNLDTTRFPTWNASLKNSMRNETLAFLSHVFGQDTSVMDFVAGKYAFLDQNLSNHYGIPLPAGAGTQMTQVALNNQRIGILTNASLLALTSVASRTSPVRRGNWLLQQILCSGVGPPPPNVPPLPPPANGATDLQAESLIRQRLAQHIEQGASCAACHNLMDPIGYGYENYDSAGIWRTTYVDGVAVDASGQLPTGETFNDFMGLAKIVQSDSRFPSCFTERLASFAEGRDMTADECTTQPIAQASVGPTKKFSDLIVQLVLDASFRSRQVSN
jgi:hypothetical protein